MKLNTKSVDGYLVNCKLTYRWWDKRTSTYSHQQYGIDLTEAEAQELTRRHNVTRDERVRVSASIGDFIRTLQDAGRSYRITN